MEEYKLDPLLTYDDEALRTDDGEILYLQIEILPIESSIKMAQGEWKPILEDDYLLLERDHIGFTNPNLHRRKSEFIPKNISYTIGVYGLNSYRTTTIQVHDEESTDSEIP